MVHFSEGFTVRAVSVNQTLAKILKNITNNTAVVNTPNRLLLYIHDAVVSTFSVIKVTNCTFPCCWDGAIKGTLSVALVCIF